MTDLRSQVQALPTPTYEDTAYGDVVNRADVLALIPEGNPVPTAAPTKLDAAWNALWRDIDLHYPRYSDREDIERRCRGAIEAAVRAAAYEEVRKRGECHDRAHMSSEEQDALARRNL